MIARCLIALVASLLMYHPAAIAAADGATSDVWVLRNVNVLAMDGQPMRMGQDVAIENRRIVAIAPTGDIDSRGTVVDGKGGYLIPGLSDMHVHLGSPLMLSLWLEHGVTRIRVMNSQPHVLQLRSEVERGAVAGPRIFLASPLMEGDPPLWPDSQPVTDPDKARRLVREYAEQGHQAIKIYDGLSVEVLTAIADEAAGLGLPVVGHMPDAVPLDALLALELSSLEHVGGLLPKWFVAGRDGCELPRNELQQLGRELAQAGTTIVPTLSLYQMLADAEARAEVQAERAFALLPEDLTRQFWASATPQPQSDRERTYRCRFANGQTLVSAYIAAGGKPLAGTDTPNPWLVPGIALHRELALLVAAGMTPEEALASATRQAAQWAGDATDRGTIDIGKIADMVLLEANPLEDISHTRRIRGVVIDGVWWSKARLQEATRAVVDSAP
jgi:cytosine/adenosine deaminase-related metal-dependent hydrolase